MTFLKNMKRSFKIKGVLAMNKAVKGIIALVSCIFLVSAVFLFGFEYEINYKLTEISTFQNEETGNAIIFQEKGQSFLFGSSEVKINLVNANGECIDDFTSTIQNDGAALQKDNVEVNWYPDYVEVILSGEEQQDEVYQLKYE